jgi:tetratricopeptide (TPR) repeat protein
MFLEFLKSFFSNLELWQEVVGGILAGAIIGTAGFFIKKTLGRRTKKRSAANVVTKGPESPVQVALGDGVTQDIRIDKSHHGATGTVVIDRVESGATINISIVDYQDDITRSAQPDVRTLFEKGRVYYDKREFLQAIDVFKRCLELERDHEKLGALNIQIGNCYYELSSYPMAEEFYTAALKEARKADDREGEASAFANIGNSYIERPALDGAMRGDNIRRAVRYYENALQIFKKDEYPVDFATTQNNLGAAYTDLPSVTPEERAENVRKAIKCYQAALEIRRKDEYPIQYAMTQNNLGNAYTYLPSVSPEERAENVRKAIKCYQAALEIRKKDEYPQDYCLIAANVGMLLATIDHASACQWLREAYALRQYLPDQGKQLEKLIKEVCGDK